MMIARDTRSALFIAVYEYLLIIAPVAIYVFLEGLQMDDLMHYWISPEWAIATIFLSFQGIALYRRNIASSGHQISERTFQALMFVSVIIIVAASVNAYLSLGGQTPAADHAVSRVTNSAAAISVRIALFTVTSIAFVALVASSSLASLQQGSRGDD